MSQKPSARKRSVATKTALASMASVPERLVFVDVADDKTERIGEQYLVCNFVTKAVHDVRGPALTTLFLLIAKRVKNLLNFDVSAIRSLPRVFEYDGFDLDVHVRRTGVEQESLKGFRFGHTRERGTLQIIREEIERLGEITL